jgi:hypothetical protein
VPSGAHGCTEHCSDVLVRATTGGAGAPVPPQKTRDRGRVLGCCAAGTGAGKAKARGPASASLGAGQSPRHTANIQLRAPAGATRDRPLQGDLQTPCCRAGGG